jgi:hypothetical protein
MVAEAEAIPERNNRSLHIQSCLGKEGTRTGIRADSNRNGAWSSIDDNHRTIERRSLLVRNSFCRTQCGSPSWRRGGRGSIGPAGKRRNARTNCFWLTNSRGLLIIAGVAAISAGITDSSGLHSVFWLLWFERLKALGTTKSHTNGVGRLFSTPAKPSCLRQWFTMFGVGISTRPPSCKRRDVADWTMPVSDLDVISFLRGVTAVCGRRA